MIEKWNKDKIWSAAADDDVSIFGFDSIRKEVDIQKVDKIHLTRDPLEEVNQKVESYLWQDITWLLQTKSCEGNMKQFWDPSWWSKLEGWCSWVSDQQSKPKVKDHCM